MSWIELGFLLFFLCICFVFHGVLIVRNDGFVCFVFFFEFFQTFDSRRNVGTELTAALSCMDAAV